jgi:hypothetical protein
MTEIDWEEIANDRPPQLREFVVCHLGLCETVTGFFWHRVRRVGFGRDRRWVVIGTSASELMEIEESMIAEVRIPQETISAH